MNNSSRVRRRSEFWRFDRFSEVLLDFEGVNFIGQAFADEIFRVFANEHREVQIIPIRAGRQIMQMIQLAKMSNSPTGK